jgi:hypothetical protein
MASEIFFSTVGFGFGDDASQATAAPISLFDTHKCAAQQLAGDL